MQVQQQIDRLLAHRAAEWVEVLKNGDTHAQREFDAWLRQSPVHVTHFLEIVALGREVRSLDPAQGEDVQAILRRVAPHARDLGATSLTTERAPNSRRSTRAWTVAASLAAVLVLTVATLLGPKLISSGTQRIETTVGEQRSIALTDGSLVMLNTSSRLRIEYSDSKRRIELDAGEAVFKVAHDAARPFEVRTRLATIRALGTQFNVYQRPEDTLISTLDGRVSVTDRLTGQTAILTANEEARVLAGGRIEKSSQADVSKAVAWQQRRLSFEEAPLEEIVQEFNRYNRGMQFRIEDVEPGTYHFGGVFDAYDTESLAILLAREPGLLVEKHAGEILIRPR